MQLLTVLPDLATLVLGVLDEMPEEEDVKAGWIAFALFIGLIIAVALLGFSLVKHLRKAEAAEAAGLYDPSGRRRSARVEIPEETPEAEETQRSERTEEPPTS
ncbi:hypothetical protein [Nocardioides pyridinolyticus]